MSFGFPKPAKGTALLERREAKAKRDGHERAEKAAVRVRDHHQCRWPRCEFKSARVRLEVAHVLGHKGWGGNPANDRSERNRMALLCFLHHQGAVSLHSGDLAIEPKTPLLMDGPCDFLKRNEAGVMELVASERYVGVSVERGA